MLYSEYWLLLSLLGIGWSWGGLENLYISIWVCQLHSIAVQSGSFSAEQYYRYIPDLLRGIDNDASQRVLVLEKTLSANQLLASGRAVENGTFYYPQISLWRQLDKDRV